MNAGIITRLSPGDPLWPTCVSQRLGSTAYRTLFARGNVELLALPKIALFCSSRCPGDAILRAYDQASEWRRQGRCVISGFHSPVEKECLRILLRGTQPITICPARALQGMRLPSDWRKLLEAGRLLLLSCFDPNQRRATAQLAARRNELVAALANEAAIIHATPGGQIAHLSSLLRCWSVPEIFSSDVVR